MFVNQQRLLDAAPIIDMLDSKEIYNGMSYGLSELGYDIRIKQSVHFKMTPSGPVTIVNDVRTGNTLMEGRFALASAIEEFDMPADLAGQVFDKSSWARHGLSLFNTVIEPGWKGFLTLELVFQGNKDIYIPAGSPIAQVVFSPVANPIEYRGKYQNQGDNPVAAIYER